MAEAWSEVLSGEVPESHLEAAYVRALRDKQGGFALTAADLVSGFRANCESERNAPRLVQDANLLNGQVCGKCHGTGMEEFTEQGYKQMRRCDHAMPIADIDADVDEIF